MTMTGESYYTYCPKCGNRMFGPRYDNLLDVLRYRCSCGHETTRSTLDRQCRDYESTTDQMLEKLARFIARKENQS